MQQHSKRYAIVFILALCFATTYAQVLDVPEVSQEQNEWCWAAVSSSVLGYYGKPTSQCTIADFTRTKATWRDFGTDNCCDVPNKKCNYWNYNYGYAGSIEDILKNWGIQSRGNGTSLTPEKIKAELNAGRPFIIRWALNPSGGHFIVGHGMVDSMVYYMDPWRGEGYKIAKYSAVSSNSSHTWQGTNVISTNPGLAKVVLVSPVDLASNMPTSPTFTWREISAVSYQFQCATTASFTTPLQKDTTIVSATTLQLTGLSSSTTYFWRVRATTATDVGAWSEVRRFTTERATGVAVSAQTVPTVTRIQSTSNGLIVTYTVPSASSIRVGIYSMRGELLHTIIDGFHHSGTYSRHVADANLAAGSYVLSIYNGKKWTSKLMLLEGRR